GDHAAQDEGRDQPVAVRLLAHQPHRRRQQAEVAEPDRQGLVSCVGAGQAGGPVGRGGKGKQSGGGGGEQGKAEGTEAGTTGCGQPQANPQASPSDYYRCARKDVGIDGEGNKEKWQGQPDGRRKVPARALEERSHGASG